MNVAYAVLASTRKAFALGIAHVEHIEPIIALFDAYLGEEGGFVKLPFCTFGGCSIVPPLRFGRDNNADVERNRTRYQLVMLRRANDFSPAWTGLVPTECACWYLANAPESHRLLLQKPPYIVQYPM